MAISSTHHAFVGQLRQRLNLPRSDSQSLQSLGQDLAAAVAQDRLDAEDLIVGAAECGAATLRPVREHGLPTVSASESRQLTGEVRGRLGHLLGERQLEVVNLPAPGAGNLKPGTLTLFKGLLDLQRYFAGVAGGVPGMVATCPIPMAEPYQRQLEDGLQGMVKKWDSWKGAPRDMVDFAVLHELAHDRFNDQGAEAGVMLLNEALGQIPATPEMSRKLEPGTAIWLEYRQGQELRADRWAAGQLAELRGDRWAPFRGFWLLSNTNQAQMASHGVSRPPNDPHPDDRVRLNLLSQFASQEGS